MNLSYSDYFLLFVSFSDRCVQFWSSPLRNVCPGTTRASKSRRASSHGNESRFSRSDTALHSDRAWQKTMYGRDYREFGVDVIFHRDKALVLVLSSRFSTDFSTTEYVFFFKVQASFKIFLNQHVLWVKRNKLTNWMLSQKCRIFHLLRRAKNVKHMVGTETWSSLFNTVEIP